MLGREGAARGPLSFRTVHLSRWLFLVSALVFPAAMLVAIPTAVANNFGSSPAGPWLANGSHHTVDFKDVQQDQESATRWALNNIYDPTQLNTEVVNGTNYDVRVIDENFGDTGWDGKTDCPDGATTGGSHPNKWCHGQILKYNLF